MRLMLLLALLAILGSTKIALTKKVPLIKHTSSHVKIVIRVPPKDIKLLGDFMRDVMRKQITMENQADTFSQQGNKALSELVHLVMTVCHREVKAHIKQNQQLWKGAPTPLLDNLGRMLEDYQKEYALGQLKQPQLKTARALQCLEVMMFCQKEVLLSLLGLIQSFFELFDRSLVVELLSLFGQVVTHFRNQLAVLKMQNAKGSSQQSKLVEANLVEVHSQAMVKLKDVETLLGMRLNSIRFYSMKDAQHFESDSQDVDGLLAQGTEETVDSLLKSQFSSYFAGVLHLTQVGRALRNKWGLGSMHEDYQGIPSFERQSRKMAHLLGNAIMKVKLLHDRNPRFNGHLHGLEKALFLLNETQDIVRKLVQVDMHHNYTLKAKSSNASEELLTQLESVVSMIQDQQLTVNMLSQYSGSGVTADKIQKFSKVVTQCIHSLERKWDEYLKFKSYYQPNTFKAMTKNVGMFQGLLSSISGKCQEVQATMLPMKVPLSHLRTGIKSSG